MYSIAYEAYLNNAYDEDYLEYDLVRMLNEPATEGFKDSIARGARAVWDWIVSMINKFRNWLTNIWGKKVWVHAKAWPEFVQGTNAFITEQFVNGIMEEGKDENAYASRLQKYEGIMRKLQDASDAMRVGVFDIVNKNQGGSIKTNYQKVDKIQINKIQDFMKRLEEVAKTFGEAAARREKSHANSEYSKFASAYKAMTVKLISDIKACLDKITYSGKDTMDTVKKGDPNAEVTIDE